MDTVTLYSNWDTVSLASLVDPAAPLRHPVPCTSLVQGEPRTYVSESHTRALYLAADLAANRHPDRSDAAARTQADAAEAALARLGENGLWVHDVSGQGETHFRFQLDGVDLLLIHAARTGDARFREAARRALTAVLSCADRLDDGSKWFLHDTFERDWAAKHARSPSMPASTCLGKSTANTLTLNTHVQTLYVLRRYRRLTGSEEFEADYAAGRAALHRVLDLKRADRRVRFYSRCIVSLMRDPSAGPLARLRHRLLWRALVRGFIADKARDPWFVHPSGYVDRDIMVTLLHTGYHVLNLADLLMLHQHDPDPRYLSVVDGGLRFCRESEYLAFMEREHAGPRPLHLDNLLMYASLAGEDRQPVGMRCDAAARDLLRLLPQRYAPTVAAHGFDPYYVPEVQQVWYETEADGELFVLHAGRDAETGSVRLLCVNPGFERVEGVVRVAPRYALDRFLPLPRDMASAGEHLVRIEPRAWSWILTPVG